MSGAICMPKPIYMSRTIYIYRKPCTFTEMIFLKIQLPKFFYQTHDVVSGESAILNFILDFILQNAYCDYPFGVIIP